jgi:uncharacterized protein (PEP-CTERM system associated)
LEGGAYCSRILLGSAILCGLVLSGPGGAVAADWTITPSISVGEGYNDNVNLGTAGTEKADLFTTISPAVNIRDTAPRLNLNLTYSPTEILYYGESSAQQLQQALLGNVHATLYPDVLFLNAQASISKEFVSGTGPVAGSTFTTSSDLQTVQAYNVSPIFRQHFGGIADTQTQYTYSYVETGGQTLPPSQTNEFNQTVTSGEDFGRLGWTLTADRLLEANGTNLTNPGLAQASDFLAPNTFASGSSYKDEYASAEAQYALFNTLAPTATVGWEHIASPTLTIPPYEIFWNVGFIWNPSQVTSLTATYGDRYGGTNIAVSGKWDPGPQTHITISYNESVQNSATLLGGNLTQLGQNAAGQNINVLTGLPFSLTQPSLPGTSINPLGLTDSSFLFKGLQATLTLTRGRDTYTGTLFYDKEIIDVPAQVETVYGGTLSWGHQLQPNLTSTLAGSYGKTDTTGTAQITPINGFGSANTSYYLITAGLTYTISPTSSATLNLTRSETGQSGGSGSVVDDVLSVVFQKQF